MNWRDVRDMLRKKLKAQHEPQKKHDFWYVHCGDVYVGGSRIHVTTARSEIMSGAVSRTA